MNERGAKEETDVVVSPAAWRTLGLTCAAVFLISLDSTVVVAAFPTLRMSFAGASASALSWILNTYTLIYAAMLVPAGGWADAHGRRRAYLLGVAIFILASVGCACAQTPGWLIVARAIQAAGAALLSPASLALTLAEFPLEKRAMAVSLWGATGALAAALGPGLGSWLIEAFSWRAIFWINVPIGLLILLWSRAQLKESTGMESRKTDWVGSALLGLGMALVVAGIVNGNDWRWLSAKTLGIFALGAAMWAGLGAWGWARPEAAINLQLFREPAYRWANLATLVFGASMGMMFLVFYLFTTGIWGYTQSQAGLAATVGPLVVIPFAVLGGKIAGRAGYRGLLLAGGGLFALAQLWYFLRMETRANYLGVLLPGQLISGAAIGLVLPSLAGAAVANLGPRDLGAGNAINQALRQLGIAAGVAAAVACIGKTDSNLADFQRAYLLLAGGGAATALLVVPLQKS